MKRGWVEESVILYQWSGWECNSCISALSSRGSKKRKWVSEKQKISNMTKKIRTLSWDWVCKEQSKKISIAWQKSAGKEHNFPYEKQCFIADWTLEGHVIPHFCHCMVTSIRTKTVANQKKARNQRTNKDIWQTNKVWNTLLPYIWKLNWKWKHKLHE